MNEERYGTLDYAKLFLLMLIPIYGFCFTLLLSFSDEISSELKCLARGAFIARIVFLVVIVLFGGIFLSSIWPVLTELFNRLGVLKFFI